MADFSFSYPLFLTSALPIFAVLMPEDKLKAFGGVRLRSTA
jgi:hypothetical protein